MAVSYDLDDVEAVLPRGCSLDTANCSMFFRGLRIVKTRRSGLVNWRLSGGPTSPLTDWVFQNDYFFGRRFTPPQGGHPILKIGLAAPKAQLVILISFLDAYFWGFTVDCFPLQHMDVLSIVVWSRGPQSNSWTARFATL